jgi:ABC-type amino acid transport substrate-binding protein
MTEDRLRHLLEAAQRPAEPRAEFASALLGDIGRELGFDSKTALDGDGEPIAVTGGAVRLRRRPVAARRTRLDLLLVAALIAAVAGGLVIVAGALRDRTLVPPTTDRFDTIQQLGRIRIAIRPDYPQFTANGQAATGFDADVAMELGRHLGLRSDVVIESAATMLQPGGADAWDVALPSVPSWTIDGSAFSQSDPYYWWPHFLVVPTSSSATGIGDLAAGPICVVAGSAGEAWLEGTYGGVAGSPRSTSITTRPTDGDCLAALASGAADAAVTANLSAADLRVNGNVRSIGGPPVEPRVAVVLGPPGDPDASRLIQLIDDALRQMHSDGTLTRLSESRFGGDDLTAH